MAQVLSLYTGGTLTLNMLTGDIRVRSGGWSPQIGDMGDGTIWDTFELIGRASSNDNYLDAIYNIQTYITNAREYILNPSREDPAWLHFRAEGGAEIRFLVYDGNLEVPGESKYGALLNNGGEGVARLALRRSVWAENTSVTTVSATGISGFGGEWAPTVTTGNLPARIKTLKVTGYAGETQDDVWIGVKPTYEGMNQFNPIWHATSGTLGTDSATASDATAHASERVTVSFATTATMAERLRISVDQVLPSDYEDMIGNYLVLGRLKGSAAVTAAQRFLIRLYQGLLGGEIEMTGEMAFTPDDTNWRLVELGYFRVPPTGYRYADSSGSALWCADSTIYLYAQRLSGTASLYIDSLLLIPTEPILTIKTGGMNAATDFAQWYSSPAGDAVAVVYDAGTTSYSIREHTAGAPMLWPIDGGTLVFAAQQTNNSKLTPTGDFEMTYYPRFSLFRAT